MIPCFTATEPLIVVYDEGAAELRSCRIHPGDGVHAAAHVHMAVCPVCMRPLTADYKPAFCTHAFTEIRWRCMFSPDLEQDVKL